jgi:prephenate dehydratase
VFAVRGLNLSKLESRPLGSEPWQFKFYLDVDVGLEAPALQEALREMGPLTTFVQVLGTYPRWR